MSFNDMLPIIFMGLMGLSMLIYVVLDGYDLGVGMLLPWASDVEKNVMLTSIGPFWDANETWLVLGVGLLLVAFPHAHGVILSALYLPVALMLFGLILRGVSFDFRIKAHDQHRKLWEKLFTLGSWIAALSQGWMIGEYVAGLTGGSVGYYAFALLIALTLPALYILLGAGWLVMKTKGALQTKALHWAHRAWLPMVLGLIAVSAATPIISEQIADKWFGQLTQFLLLLPIPLITIVLLGVIYHVTQSSVLVEQGYGWLIFGCTLLVCVLSMLGLAYSIFPYIVIGQTTIWQAASSSSSLKILLFGACISLPMILIYTVWVYRIFWGSLNSEHGGH